MILPVWLALRREGGCLLSVHVQPGAKRSEVVGDYGEALKIRLAAPPVDGRANAALIAFVAATLAVAPAAVSLVSGETSRRKRLAVDLDPAAVAARLTADRR